MNHKIAVISSACVDFDIKGIVEAPSLRLQLGKSSLFYFTMIFDRKLSLSPDPSHFLSWMLLEYYIDFEKKETR